MTNRVRRHKNLETIHSHLSNIQPRGLRSSWAPTERAINSFSELLQTHVAKHVVGVGTPYVHFADLVKDMPYHFSNSSQWCIPRSLSHAKIEYQQSSTNFSLERRGQYQIEFPFIQPKLLAFLNSKMLFLSNNARPDKVHILRQHG